MVLCYPQHTLKNFPKYPFSAAHFFNAALSAERVHFIENTPKLTLLAAVISESNLCSYRLLKECMSVEFPVKYLDDPKLRNKVMTILFKP